MTNSNRLTLLLLTALLAACSARPPTVSIITEPQDSAPARRLDPNAIQDAVPRVEPRSSRGNPASYEVFGHRYSVMQSSQGYAELGIASWYGVKFHGRSTSSGEPYDMYAMTAAHKSLPLPTYVEVTNLRNGRSTIVKVNDRGPFHDNRLIDLSYAAATKLGILGQGTGLVEVRALDPAQPTMITRLQPAQPTVRSDRPSAPLTVSPDLFVQVGAFSNRDNALRLRNRLEPHLASTVRIRQAESNGRRVFRVQVGPLLDVKVTDAVTLKLAHLGINDTQIIIE